MKVELILEGGGMRGIYTAGVLDFFLDNKIKFKDICAVSAGACTATSYLSNQPKRTLQMMTDYASDKRYLSISSYIKTGSAFGIDFIFRTIPDELLPFDYETFKNSGINMTVVCTDLNTGKPLYFKVDDVKEKLDYVIASSSLPFVSKPVVIDGYCLYDGGVSDPVPIKRSIEEGYDFQVLVLTRNAGYRKNKSLSNRMIARTFYKHKDFSNVMSTRHEIYNESMELIEKLENEKKAIVIRPSEPLVIDRFEKDITKLKDLYDLGYRDAKEKFQEIFELAKKVTNLEIE